MTAPRITATTGHPLGDALLPASLALVDAVRRGDPRAAHEAAATAHRVAKEAKEPNWIFVWVCTLAALVPTDRSVGDLLAWVDQPRRVA